MGSVSRSRSWWGSHVTRKLQARLSCSTSCTQVAACDHVGTTGSDLRGGRRGGRGRSPSEEFDRAVWLDCTAVCALRLGQPDQAGTRFREALEATPNEWIPRRVFSTIGLATALTDSGDLEAALELSDSLVPQLQTVQSRELTEHFVSYLRTGLLAKYPGHPHGQALLAEATLTSKQL